MKPEVEKISETLTLDKIKELKEIYYMSLNNKNDTFIKLSNASEGSKLNEFITFFSCTLDV